MTTPTVPAAAAAAAVVVVVPVVVSAPVSAWTPSIRPSTPPAVRIYVFTIRARFVNCLLISFE